MSWGISKVPWRQYLPPDPRLNRKSIAIVLLILLFVFCSLPNVQYTWGYLPLSGLHVMMYLDLIGRVAGNGNNKVMDLDPIP